MKFNIEVLRNALKNIMLSQHGYTGKAIFQHSSKGFSIANNNIVITVDKLQYDDCCFLLTGEDLSVLVKSLKSTASKKATVELSLVKKTDSVDMNVRVSLISRKKSECKSECSLNLSYYKDIEVENVEKTTFKTCDTKRFSEVAANLCGVSDKQDVSQPELIAVYSDCKTENPLLSFLTANRVVAVKFNAIMMYCDGDFGVFEDMQSECLLKNKMLGIPTDYLKLIAEFAGDEVTELSFYKKEGIPMFSWIGSSIAIYGRISQSLNINSVMPLREPALNRFFRSEHVDESRLSVNVQKLHDLIDETNKNYSATTQGTTQGKQKTPQRNPLLIAINHGAVSCATTRHEKDPTLMCELRDSDLFIRRGGCENLKSVIPIQDLLMVLNGVDDSETEIFATARNERYSNVKQMIPFGVYFPNYDGYAVISTISGMESQFEQIWN